MNVPMLGSPRRSRKTTMGKVHKLTLFTTLEGILSTLVCSKRLLDSASEAVEFAVTRFFQQKELQAQRAYIIRETITVALIPEAQDIACPTMQGEDVLLDMDTCM